jgi:hypothetical protein
MAKVMFKSRLPYYFSYVNLEILVAPASQRWKTREPGEVRNPTELCQITKSVSVFNAIVWVTRFLQKKMDIFTSLYDSERNVIEYYTLIRWPWRLEFFLWVSFLTSTISWHLSLHLQRLQFIYLFLWLCTSNKMSIFWHRKSKMITFRSLYAKNTNEMVCGRTICSALTKTPIMQKICFS